MKYETLQGLSLPKLGFGTWRIGGGLKADLSRDSASMRALRCALETGYTHFDTAEIYADGHAEKLLGQAIRESALPRESLFITSKVSPEHLGHDRLVRSCEHSLRRLHLDYLDLYLIHWPPIGFVLDETFRALRQLVRDGKVRHVGVSNFTLNLLTEARAVAELPIVTNQMRYNLSERSYVPGNMLDYCRTHAIALTAYSPFSQGTLKPGPTLRSIAEAHAATPHQIALAWLIAQRPVITIPMSFDPVHIAQNMAAVNITLTHEDIANLTDNS